MTRNTLNTIHDVLDAAEHLGDRDLEALCYLALGETPDNVLPEAELAALIAGGMSVEDAQIEVLDWASDTRGARGF